MSVAGLPAHVLTGVDALLRDRAPALGNATFGDIRGLLRDHVAGLLDESGLRTLLHDIRAYGVGAAAAVPAAAAAAAAEPAAPASDLTFEWPDGTVRNLPQDFKFPSVPLLPAWQLYCCGNPAKEWRPLRIVTPGDICIETNKTVCHRLSDFHALLGELEIEAKRLQMDLSPGPGACQRHLRGVLQDLHQPGGCGQRQGAGPQPVDDDLEPRAAHCQGLAGGAAAARGIRDGCRRSLVWAPCDFARRLFRCCVE